MQHVRQPSNYGLARLSPIPTSAIPCAPPRAARSADRGPSLAALRLRRALRLAPGLILAWTLATLLAVRLSGVAQLTGTHIGDAFARSLIVGLLVGLSAAWLEANVLPSWARRLPLAVVLALQTVGDRKSGGWAGRVRVRPAPGVMRTCGIA